MDNGKSRAIQNVFLSKERRAKAMPEKYCFGVYHLALLGETKTSLEAAGYTCHVETELVAGYTLHVLVATPASRPNRKERGCEL